MSPEFLLKPRITRVIERRPVVNAPTAEQVRDSVNKSVPKITPVWVGFRPFDITKKIR